MLSLSRLMLTLALSLSLIACRQEDLLAELEANAKTLHSNLEEKRAAAVHDQLHKQFLAQQQYDADWAKRTLALMFLRHRQIRIISLSQSHRLDPQYRHIGYTTAEVLVSGAEHLLPNSAGHYSVTLQWWREGDQWQLARIDWN